MDAIKRLSNEKRIRIEDNLENAKEKIERFSYKFTPGQYADWVHIINFYQMKLALDDLASPADSSSKVDNALEAVRQYYTSLLSSNAMMCGLQVNLYPLSLTQSNILGYDLNKASLESPAGINQTLS